METIVKGIYENGKVTLVGASPVQSRTEVTVTFPDRVPKQLKKRQAGVLSGISQMSDDFNDPLDELKGYM
jgi:hypothetical protein